MGGGWDGGWGPGAPPTILKERLGRVRLAAHGLSFSIIDKSPGATHKYVFGETLPSLSAGTGMGTGGNRFSRIYTRCCLAQARRSNRDGNRAGTDGNRSGPSSKVCKRPRRDAQTGTGTGREPTGTIFCVASMPQLDFWGPQSGQGANGRGPLRQVDSENNWPVGTLMQLDGTDLSPKCYMATLSRHFEINFRCQGEF